MAVLIYGATGFTGGLVVEEAQRRGIRPILAGRRKAALQALAQQWSPALDIRVAHPDDRASLDAMLEGAEVLITTVGPFTDYGLQVASAAVDHGVHYLDTTGEQTFMADCRALFHERMQNQKRLMINAAAFEYTPGTLAAARFLQEHPQTTTLNVVYDMGMGSGGKASRGTLKSMLRLAGAEGIGYQDRVFTPMRTLDHVQRFVLEPQTEAQPVAQFPGGEVLAVPRFASLQAVKTWIVLAPWLTRMRPLSQAMLKTAQDGLVYSALSAMIDRMPSGPSDAARSRSDGHIVLNADSSYVDVICPDPYGLTARIAVDLALRIEQDTHQAYGVISAAEAFDTMELWQTLETWGVTYQQRL